MSNHKTIKQRNEVLIDCLKMIAALTENEDLSKIENLFKSKKEDNIALALQLAKSQNISSDHICNIWVKYPNYLNTSVEKEWTLLGGFFEVYACRVAMYDGNGCVWKYELHKDYTCISALNSDEYEEDIIKVLLMRIVQNEF